VLLLAQAIRRAGRPSFQVPSPTVSVVGSMFRRAGLVDVSPEQLQFLQFGRVVDTTRLQEAFGYRPAYTTLEAFDDFVHGRALTRFISPERAELAEHLVLDVLERRRTAHA
jgi:UDP-glucose 4-epimerase